MTRDFFLPPSVDAWLRNSASGSCVVAVIDGLDLRAMEREYRASAFSTSNHLAMLRGILVCGYATGVISGRKLEEVI